MTSKYFHDGDGGEKLKYDSSWEGVVPAEQRGCRDLPCALIFVACLTGMAVMTGVAGSNSDLRLIDRAGSEEDDISSDLHVLHDNWGVLLAGVSGTLVLAFLWLELLKRFTRCVVYSSIAAALVFVVLTGVFLLTHGSTYSKVAGVLVLVVAVVLAGMTFFARKKINFSCAIVGHSCRAVQNNLSIFLVLTPLLVLLLVGYLVWWSATGLYLFSIRGKEIDCSALTSHGSCLSHGCDWNSSNSTCSGTGYDLDKTARWGMLYLVFMLFWGPLFFAGISKTTVSGTIAIWYFARDKASVGWCNSMRVFGWCWRYHFGSIALGSGLIAVLKFIEWCLEKAQQETENKFVKVVLCLVRCFVGCFEALLRFVTKYGYVYIAMHGNSFFTACKEVQGLFKRSSFGTLFINDLVTHLIVRLGMAAAAGIVVFSSEMYMKSHDGISVTCALVLSFFCCFTFLLVGNVVEIASDTVIVCFMEDGERNASSRDFLGGETYSAILSASEGRKLTINRGSEQPTVYGS